MFRYEVPIGSGPVELMLSSNPMAVQLHPMGHIVEFWAESYSDNAYPIARTFEVFGTGHLVPDNAHYWGTTIRTAGLIWHLYELKGVM